MDGMELTYVCPSRPELRTARGRRWQKRRNAVIVGLGCSRPVPKGPLGLWAYAGSLTRDLRVGEPVEGSRIVDENGKEIWRRPSYMQPSGLREVTFLDTPRVIDDPVRRLELASSSKAKAINVEAGILVKTGQLHRIICTITDDPDALLRLMAYGLKLDGEIDWRMIGWALRLDPWRTSLTLGRIYFKGERTFKALRLA